MFVNNQVAERLLSLVEDYESRLVNLETIASHAFDRLDNLDKQIEAMRQQINDLHLEIDDGRQEVRNTYDAVIEGRKELDDARKEVCNAYDAVIEGRKELDDARKEVCNAYDAVIDMRSEVNDTRMENRRTFDIATTMKDRFDSERRYSENEYTLYATIMQRRVSPQLLVAGFYGADNYGDELMLRTLLGSFPPDLLDNTTVLLCDNERYDSFDLPDGVCRIHYPNSIWGIDALADMFDCLIWGGGALIDDSQFRNESLDTGNLFIRLSKRMVARHKDVWAIALSTNCLIESHEYIHELDYIIERCRLFSLRDNYSKAVLINAGIDGERLQECCDIALANPDFAKDHKYNTDGPIGLALICSDELATINIALIRGLDEALTNARSNKEVVLVPCYEMNENDSSFYTRVLNSLSLERFHVGKFSRGVLSSEISNCCLFISCRYHGVIVARELGIPTVSISWNKHPHYRNKMMWATDNYPSNGFNIDLDEVVGNEVDLFSKAIELISDSCVTQTATASMHEKVAAQLEPIINDLKTALDGDEKGSH